MRQHVRLWSLRLLSALLAISLLAPGLIPAVQAQGNCGDAPAPRLIVGGEGFVMFTDGNPLNVRDAATLNGAVTGQLPEGTAFSVLDGPVCADDIFWWRVTAGALSGWIAEGVAGEYFVEPQATIVPPPPTVPIRPASEPFFSWNWAAFVGDSWMKDIPDPMTIAPPATYAGDLPPLPIDLSQVTFLDDANLNEAQRALLAQNGFVVVPAGFDQFHEAYRETETWWAIPPDYNWEADPATQTPGHAFFVTTDAMLHALHYIFDNLLTDLEKEAFHAIVTHEVVVPALEQAARSAELYLVVGLELLEPGLAAAITSPDLMDEAAPLVQMALAGEGRYDIPFLPGTTEDFSQYRPRGHYDGDPLLERYFRGMMWLSRLTFLANDSEQTLIALMLLRALQTSPQASQGWVTFNDTLSFLIGPVDDLGPPDYAAIALTIYGPSPSLDDLADSASLAGFQQLLADLPGPRVNGLILPNDTEAEDMPDLTRGFRFMGQRFTLDAYAMQQLMYPYVGTRENPRLLPLGLDVALAMSGSDMVYQLAMEAGAGDYLNYDAQVLKLASEIGVLTDEEWLENVYGGWLWALRPLWDRNPAAYPPMMNTVAWLRKDLQTGLASWTELKHDTVLYAKQPTGFGGGGPPLTSFGYVEPNPLVFARIAVVATMTYQGLTARNIGQDSAILQTTLDELHSLAYHAARFAEIARKELAGEPLSEDDYGMIFYFDTYLYILLHTLYQGEGEPDPVALVTDVASNPSINAVLQEGVGGVDYIYVVVPIPFGGWQLVRGGVFSYYEWVGNIDQRMTDAEWRAQIASGTQSIAPHTPR